MYAIDLTYLTECMSQYSSLIDQELHPKVQQELVSKTSDFQLVAQHKEFLKESYINFLKNSHSLVP